MKINKKMLDFCSENLLLDFTEEEINFLFNELNDVIESLERIKEMNLSNVDSTDYPIKNKNALRDDNDFNNNAVEYVKTIKNYKDGYVKVEND